MPAAKKEKLVCFFITPIGKPDSEERRRADQIQRHILSGTLSSKYNIVRADEMSHPGSVTHQIIELLYKADLVIADLTGSNANVAYELAIRHSFNKVSIHLVDKSEAIPFDLKDERTIVFDLNDIDSIEECKAAIKKFVDVILSGRVPYRSPVFRVLGVVASTTEEQVGFLNKISEQIDAIATDVTSIESTLTFSDIEDISSIKETIDDLSKSQDEIAKILDDLKDEVSKLGDE